MSYRFLRHAQYKEITTNLVKEQEDREKERILAQNLGKSLGHCVTKVFRGRHNTLSQDRDHKTDPSIDTTKVQPVDNELY